MSDAFVASALQKLFDEQGLKPEFSLLAPRSTEERVGYVLYVQGLDGAGPTLARALDSRLSENPHYELCLRIGQLAPLEVAVLEKDGHRAYVDRCAQAGQRLGDIKPAALSTEDGWDDVFKLAQPARRNGSSKA